MKPISLNKKLILNKKTIDNLTYDQMWKNRGGGGPTEPPLASCNDFDETKCAICTEPIPIPMPPNTYNC
jgi:hypothetical protein